MSAIIEEAERTTCHDISGGGITSTHLWNGLVDRQSVSYRIHGSNYYDLTRSFFRTKQSDLEQDDVQVGHGTRRYNGVNGSANQNLSNSFMESELKIMHGERRGIHVIQHYTNNTVTKTGEKPGYMPSGLAFSTDVYHRNNRKAAIKLL